MKKQLFASVAFAALTVPGLVTSGAAFAQSTGSREVDDEIIVTATNSKEEGISGVQLPDTSKPRAVLTEEIISKQQAGQSIINTINLVPGVNFTNNDAFGSSGGNLRIRGFDGNRVSLTFDGFPLNDTGNYAIFSNQQLDPELICSVNVNLGTTDIDSPTASASGGTVNYRTCVPKENAGAILSGSMGSDEYARGFVKVESGDITSFGTRVWVAGAKAFNRKFKGPGSIDKWQINGGIYQPLERKGDFIHLMAHYNQNRNAFYRNPSIADLRLLTGRPNMVEVDGFDSTMRAAILGFENFDSCTKTFSGAGAQNDNAGILPNGGANAPAIVGNTTNNILNTSSCTNFYGLRINPSNTWNIRMNSRYTLADNLVWTVDGAFQYVLANGGGTTVQGENSALVRGSTALPGVDYNGDGDVVDSIRFYTPNNTNTRRLTLMTSLIWDLNDDHKIRVAYTYDRGRHRQTGEWGYINAQGVPENVFGGREGRKVLSADLVPLRQRDRLSIALLNQIAGEYIGKFLDDKLTVNVGLRLPFFERELNNFCYQQAAGANATCTSQPILPVGTVPAAGLTYFVPANYVVPTTVLGTPLFAPFKAKYKFSPTLPSAGLRYKVTDALSLNASYAKGFSAPRTDNLYRAPIVTIDPETTDTFDFGIRYITSRIQASATYWNTQYKNRIVTSFDALQGISIDRNVGSVSGQGVDIGVAMRPFDWFTFQGNASYNNTKLKNDIATSPTITIPTAGKRITETPEWTLGYRAEINKGPFLLGLQVKYVGERFATDLNDLKVGSYTVADLDARVNLKDFGLNKNSWLQFNVSNLFNRFYVGGISSQIAGANNNGLVLVPGVGAGLAIPGGANPTFTIASPRKFSVTLRVGL